MERNDNAADSRRVRQSRKTLKRERQLYLSDLRELLKLPAFRRVVWTWIEYFSPLRSIFEPSSKIYYNAGLQDAGHFVLAELDEADPAATLRIAAEQRRKEPEGNSEESEGNIEESEGIE